MLDENMEKRAKIKHYDVSINGVVLHANAQSLGEALRRVSNLILYETDVVTVKLEA